MVFWPTISSYVYEVFAALGHMTVHLKLHATSLSICVCMGTCTCMVDGEYTDVHQVLHIHSNAKTLAMVNWKHKCFFASFPLFFQSSWWSVHMLTMEASSKKKNNWCHDLHVWTWEDYNPQRWSATSTPCMYKCLFIMLGGCGIHVRIMVPPEGIILHKTTMVFLAIRSPLGHLSRRCRLGFWGF